MPNLTARQMLARLPVRMAKGGAAKAFSDDEVKQFIQNTYAQFGGPGVEAHRAIGDAMAQYGVGVDQVARASGYSPQEVQAELMGQRAAAPRPERPQVPVLPDSRGPSGPVDMPSFLIGIPSGDQFSPASPSSIAGKTQGVMTTPPATAQRLDMLMAQEQAMAPVKASSSPPPPPSLPPVQAQATEQPGTAAGVSAAYRAAMEKGGQQTVGDYYANLRKDAEAYLANANAPTGVDAYNQLIQSGISTSDLRAAGVADAVLNKIFTVQAPIKQEQFVTPTGMTSAYERSPDLAFESQRLTARGQDGRAILDKQGRDYVANLQQGGIDAAERAQMLEYATERGYSFDDLIKAGVDPNVLFTQRAAVPPVVPPPVVPPPVVPPPVVPPPVVLTGGVTPKDLVAAVTPTYNAQQLRDIIAAAEKQPAALGTVTNPMDTRGSAATGSQSGVSKFLDTYEAPKPFVAPTYTAPTVYGQLPTQPDIYAAGQAALDTAFRESSPRTAIPGLPGQFDYSPAAKLRPATGAGFTFTPPSVTTRPRSLLSPREVQAYGGLGPSKSQQFAQNRAAIDRNLRTLQARSPALRNASNYALLRNRIMAQEFGDPQRVFDPKTPEGQQLQAFIASLEAGAPTGQAVKTDATVGTGATDVDQTDSSVIRGSGSSTQPGGYAAAIDGGDKITYGGYDILQQAKGGLVKKPDGSAKDELARFANGGEADAELLRRQLENIDNTPSTRTPEREPTPEQTESRAMLENLRSGFAQIPQTVMGYGRDVLQSEAPLAKVGADVSALGSGAVEGLKQDPAGFILDMLPVVGEIRSGRDAVKYSDLANEARAANDLDAAAMYEQMSTLAAAGATPLIGTAGRLSRRIAGAPDEAMMRMAGSNTPTAADDLAELTDRASPIRLTRRAPLDRSQEAREARAAEQGYTPTLYHGTASLDNAAFDEFNKKFFGSVTNSPSAKLGTWLTDDPKTANIYASFAPFSSLQKLQDKYDNAVEKLWRTTSNLQREERIVAREEGKLKLAPLADKIKQATDALEAGVPDPAEARKFFPLPTRIGGGGGANIMPVRARGNFMEYDAGDTSIRELQDKKGLTKLGKEARDAGYDGLKITNFRDPMNAPSATHYLVFDPKNIRSVNADFDPDKLDSANLGYAKGGEVSSAKDMLDRLTSAR